MIDRRRFLKATGGVAVAAGATAFLAACGQATSSVAPSQGAASTEPSASPEGSTIPEKGTGMYGGPAPVQIGGEVIFVGGSSVQAVRDARQKYIVDVMKADYDVDATLVTSLDYARMAPTMQLGRADFDIVSSDTFFSLRAAEAGWLEPIDYGIVDASQLVDGSDFEFWVNTAIGAHHIVWRTEGAFGPGAGPISWQEFYDVEKFPGRRALRSGAFQTLPGAAMADGVAPADLYPLDMDRAFKSLDRIRPHVVKFADGDQVLQDMILANEADFVHLFTGRAATLKRDGEPIDFRMEEASSEEVSFIIPKGTPNLAQAQYTLALLVNQAEYNKAMSEAQLIGYTNLAAMDIIDPAVLPLLTTSEANRAVMAPNGSDWWAEHETEAQQRMTEWILG
jgi:putative spermidine/putrescine transport system substrate-binding protein